MKIMGFLKGSRLFFLYIEMMCSVYVFNFLNLKVGRINN